MAKKESTQERVVLVSKEDDLVRFMNVETITQGNIHCNGYVLPLNDASMVKISEQGRVFFYNCSLDYIAETQHLAEVEKNIVLNKALIFKGETEEKKGPGFFTYFTFTLMALILIITVVSK